MKKRTNNLKHHNNFCKSLGNQSKGIFLTQSNIYDKVFYAKIVKAIIYIFKTTSIMNFWQGSKYNCKATSNYIQNGCKTIFEGYVMLLYVNDVCTWRFVYMKEYLVVHCKGYSYLSLIEKLLSQK